MVQDERTRSAVAADARSVRDPRLGGDAPADAGGTRHSALPRVARPLALGRGTRRRVARGRDPRVAGARLQPQGPQPAPSGLSDRRRRLAGGPDRASRSRSLYGQRAGAIRPRPPRAPDRRERAPSPRQERGLVRSRSGPRADGSRRHHLSRADPTLRRMSSGERLPFEGEALRAAPQAGPIRGLVQAAAGRRAQPRLGAAPATELARRGRRRSSRRRRPRAGT